MSKKIEILKNLEQSRSADQSVSKPKAKLSSSEVNELNKRELNRLSRNSRIHTTWIFGAVLLILLAINFIFTISLFINLKGYTSVKDETSIKLAVIEDLLKDKVSAISLDIRKVNLSVEEKNEKIKELIKDNDSKTVALENLIKAKNTLFKKLTELEVELNQLKTIQK